jgi:acyl-CoA reductase-like NAD-dependent aldehyde dehydrogenase
LLSEAGDSADPAAVVTGAVGERTVSSRVTSPAAADTSADSDANGVIDADPARLDVVDARTGTPIRSLATDSEHEVDAKIARARAALPAWAARGHAERSGPVLEALARIDDDRDELASIAACETGADESAIARDLAAAVAGALTGIDGGGDAGRADTHGVVAIVTGSADPHTTLVTTGLRAVVAGSTIVVKPSPAATLSALAIVERLHECGVPADVVQCVVGGAAAGAAVVCAGVDLVCFAGEHETGAKVARLAGERSTPTDLVLRSSARTRDSGALR